MVIGVKLYGEPIISFSVSDDSDVLVGDKTFYFIWGKKQNLAELMNDSPYGILNLRVAMDDALE